MSLLVLLELRRCVDSGVWCDVVWVWCECGVGKCECGVVCGVGVVWALCGVSVV